MSEIQPLLSYPLLFNKLIYCQPLGTSAIDTSQCYFCSLSRKVKKMEVSVQTEVSTSRKKFEERERTRFVQQGNSFEFLCTIKSKILNYCKLVEVILREVGLIVSKDKLSIQKWSPLEK